MISAQIPMPLQIVIDDVGWWSGEDGGKKNEPFRTGIARDHVPADYAAIVQLGRELDMRPQAAMILCEWDRENILRDLPTSTWMGGDWDNARWQGPHLDEAAQIIRDGRDHFELVLHGVGHEYWTDGVASRAEWHDKVGAMRPECDVRAHLDFYQRLLDQHDLGPFPRSFVPAAFLHCFGPEERNLASILKQAGVTYISTPYSTMHKAAEIPHGVFGFDAGLMTVDRGRDILNWMTIGTGPTRQPDGPICGMHWPNVLHDDPARNGETVDAWVSVIRECGRRADRALSRDTTAFCTQLAHHVCTTCEATTDGISLDFSEYAKLPQDGFEDTFVIKLTANEELAFSSDDLDIPDTTCEPHGSGIMQTVKVELRDHCTTAVLDWQPLKGL